jgi:hypothetical protein
MQPSGNATGSFALMAITPTARPRAWAAIWTMRFSQALTQGQ